VRAFFRRQIIIIFALLFGYISLTVWLLQSVRLWDASQIKITLLWSLLAGTASLFRVASSTGSSETHLFRSWISENLRILIFVEFIATLYTFPLAVELVLIPAVAIIAGMAAIAEYKPEHKPVLRILNTLLASFGAFLVIYAVYQIVSDFDSFANADTMMAFYTPPLLSFLIVPFLYGVHVYVSYQNAFLRIDFVFKDSDLRSYAKRRAVISFGPCFELLRRWLRNVTVERPESRRAINQCIRNVKKIRKREKDPPAVAPEDGWSPFLACEFLVGEGLKTGDYHQSFGEWYAASPYLEIGEGILPDNIAYYVEGDEHTAKRLKLVLNVNNPEGEATSEAKLFAIARILVSLAFERSGLDDVVDRLFADDSAYTILDSRSIKLTRQNWEGGIKGGYDKRFIIEQNGS
jgi:hypothetical protein